MSSFKRGSLSLEGKQNVVIPTNNGDLTLTVVGTEIKVTDFNGDEKTISFVEDISGGSGFTPLEGSGITITPSGDDYIFEVSDYISKTEVADITGDFVLKSGDTMTGSLIISDGGLDVSDETILRSGLEVSLSGDQTSMEITNVGGSNTITNPSNLVVIGKSHVIGDATYSVVHGLGNEVTNSVGPYTNTTVVGTYNEVTDGRWHSAVGYYNKISGLRACVSVGYGNNNNTDSGTVALGRYNNISGRSSVGIGTSNTINTSDVNTVAIGAYQTTTNSSRSVAIGLGCTVVNSIASVALGRYVEITNAVDGVSIGRYSRVGVANVFVPAVMSHGDGVRNVVPSTLATLPSSITAQGRTINLVSKFSRSGFENINATDKFNAAGTGVVNLEFGDSLVNNAVWYIDKIEVVCQKVVGTITSQATISFGTTSNPTKYLNNLPLTSINNQFDREIIDTILSTDPVVAEDTVFTIDTGFGGATTVDISLLIHGKIMEVDEWYYVTFDPQGGNMSSPYGFPFGLVNTKIVLDGYRYGTLPVASRSGFTLDGWYTAPAGGGTQITANDIFNEGNNNLILYANWV